jgi:hypothetical protein
MNGGSRLEFLWDILLLCAYGSNYEEGGTIGVPGSVIIDVAIPLCYSALSISKAVTALCEYMKNQMKAL